MAIVKMKRLRLIAMLPQQEELLKVLQQLGCVEVGQRSGAPDSPQWAALSQPDSAALDRAREECTTIADALDTLKQYAPPKGGLLQGRPVVPEGEFFHDGVYAAALELAARINESQRQIFALRAEQSKLRARKASLAPWLALDVPLDTPSTREVAVTFGSVPARVPFEELSAALTEGAPLAQLISAGDHPDAHHFLLLCHSSQQEQAAEILKEFSFSPAVLKDWSGTAAENDRALELELAQLDTRLAAVEEDILSCAGRRGELRQAADRAALELSRQEAKGRLLDTTSAFWLEGWLPADKVPALAEALDPFSCAWDASDPDPEDYPEVPVQLRNNILTRPLNMVTEMYSLPAYDGVDPNPLMAPFFILFYGIMMADMGYGLLMMLASLVIQKKTRPNGPTMRHMIPLLGLCGVSTFVLGALTGSFFGDLIPQLVGMLNPGSTFALPALFSPLDDALMVLIGSLALGLVQIFTGMGISMYRQIKRGETMAALCNEGAWYLVFLLFAVGLLAGQLKIALIAIVILLAVTQSYGKKGIVGKLMGIGGSLYNNITGYFSDIFSYSRLMALMLAGAVIAQVFNTLGAITGNVILFFLIAAVGNALNFALNLLGCYVHDMRLQCLEYFGRFYDDGGKPFKPLAVETRFVDVAKK